MRYRYVIARKFRTWGGRLERVRTLAAERRFGVLLRETAGFLQRRMFGMRQPGAPNTSVSQDEFDTRYDTDTAQSVSVSSLGIDGPGYVHAHRYEPSPVAEFIAILNSLPICFQHYSFIDLGSGKGRILMEAANWPFEHIIGVEISESLHRIAQRNISLFLDKRPEVTPIELILGDVYDYLPPNSPLVVYLYNPFYRVVLARVIEKLEIVARLISLPLYIIYYQPLWKRLIEESSSFVRMGTYRSAAVFASRQGAETMPHPSLWPKTAGDV